MTRLLEQAHQQNKLNICNSKLAAEQFLSLLCGHQHMRVLFEIEATPNEAAQQQFAQQHIDFFMRVYGASPSC